MSDSNVRPGKTLETVIDDAFCTCDMWEIRLDEFKSPTLESRATLYPKGAGDRCGVIVMPCDELRSHYRKYFDIPEPPIQVNYDEPEPPISIIGDDGDDDHWGDEYLDDGEELEPEDYRIQKSPTPEQYLAWKLRLLSIIRRRFEVVEHFKSKTN